MPPGCWRHIDPSAEYQARLVKAQDTYIAKYGATVSNQTEAAPMAAPAAQVCWLCSVQVDAAGAGS